MPNPEKIIELLRATSAISIMVSTLNPITAYKWVRYSLWVVVVVVVGGTYVVLNVGEVISGLGILYSVSEYEEEDGLDSQVEDEDQMGD